MFENVSWGEMNFTEIVNAIIDFVLAIVKGEFPLFAEFIGKKDEEEAA